MTSTLNVYSLHVNMRVRMKMTETKVTKAMKATRYKVELTALYLDEIWIVEPKLDGMRMHAYISANNTVIIKSYADKVMGYWKGVFEDSIIKFVRKGLRISGAYVLDGEVKLRNGTFQETMSAKAEDADKSDLVYWVFDHMPMKAWKAKRYDELQISRTLQLAEAKSALKRLHRGKCIGNVDVLPYSECKPNALQRSFEFALKAGHEGIVAKRHDLTYEWKRSKAWLKMKALHTYDGQIVAIHEGEGKFLGTAGSITVEGTIDNEHATAFTTNVNLSTDEVRAYFWKNRKKLLKRKVWVEIQAQEPSYKRSRGNGKVAALRGSKYVKLREDK